MTSAGGNPEDKGSLPESLENASVLESLKFSLLHFLPYLLRGVFTKNRFWTFVFDALDSDAHVVKFCQELRSKYRSNLIYIRMIGGKSLLVFSESGISRVLNNSPTIYGDAELKAKGMSHFQPNALTISEGEEWKDRRFAWSPEGAATLAALPQMADLGMIREGDRVVLVNTASPEKYLPTIRTLF